MDGSAVTFDGYTSGKHVLTEDATFVFNTVEAQRFIAIKYRSEDDFASGADNWTADIMAVNYNELPTILQSQKYTPANVYYEYFVVTPDGDKKVMGNEYLSKYDLYMRGTHGYKAGEVLATVSGTLDQIDLVFDKMKNGEGKFKEYSEFFTYTLEAQYLTGMHKVYFYAPDGTCGQDNVKYGETYKVPDYWVNNINQSVSERISGWDIDGDGRADILPSEQFTVTRDMVLRPVMTATGYTITFVDGEGNSRQYALDAGETIPAEIASVINSAPETPTASEEDSFYSDSYLTIITSDFVEGNDRSAYFKGVSWVYNRDITVMPACDVVISVVNGKLYHYVTIVDKTEGYFTYKNESGESVEAKTVKIAVQDGGVLGTSKDYNAKELKYTLPAGVTYYSPSYLSADGEELDFYNTAITKPITYNHTTWERRDGTYSVRFEYHLNTNGDVSKETRLNVVGIADETKLNELLANCDAEYDRLTSDEYCKSLNDDEFEYTIDIGWSVKNSRITDGYGVTLITYIVCVKKTTKSYTVYFDYDTKNYVNSTDSVKYGKVVCVPTSEKEVEVEDEFGRYVDYYRIIGFDTDGDGVADVMPGELIVVLKDMTFKAIYEDKPYSRSEISYK